MGLDYYSTAPSHSSPTLNGFFLLAPSQWLSEIWWLDRAPSALNFTPLFSPPRYSLTREIRRPLVTMPLARCKSDTGRKKERNPKLESAPPSQTVAKRPRTQIGNGYRLPVSIAEVDRGVEAYSVSTMNGNQPAIVIKGRDGSFLCDHCTIMGQLFSIVRVGVAAAIMIMTGLQ